MTDELIERKFGLHVTHTCDINSGSVPCLAGHINLLRIFWRLNAQHLDVADDAVL